MVFERYIKNYMHEFDLLDRCVWNYEDGCVLTGAQAMYEATGDEYYFNSIQGFIDRYVNEDGIRYYDIAEYNIDRIPSGRVLYLLYKKTGNESYRNAIELLMNQLRTHPRTQCGNFWHKKIYPYQVWLDGLYMGMPFYLMYANEFGEKRCYDDMIRQFQNVRKYLYDEEKHLYYHAYDEKKEMFWADKNTGLSPNFWSRALGWYLMALADCYELLPASWSDGRRILADLWKEALDGILLYQDRESGLFYQLTALPGQEGNYLETSASAMIAYALLKGCRSEVLPGDYYRTKGEEILIALETRMFTISHSQLQLNNMCAGAGLGPADNTKRDGSIAYYLTESVVHDEQKGTGAVMMAYSEWIKLQKKEKNAVSGIKVEIYNSGYN